MARRYGGRFSPPGAVTGDGGARPERSAPLANRRVRAAGGRARLLYLLPLPLFFAGLGATLRGSPIEAAVELAGFAGLMLAAWLTNEGLRAEAVFAERTVAKPPALPRKLLAAALIGTSVAGVGLLSLGQGLVGAVVFGLIAAAAHVVAFGPDPLRAKGVEGADTATTDRVARAIDEAEQVLAETMEAARRIRDRRLEARIERICDQARDVFRAIERDPRDLARARRFLSVYIVGLRDATRKFADLWARRADPRARGDFEALLGDLETSFASKRAALLEDRSGDLEIEIAVLRERLQQDGLTAR
jgi:hypothetical protein